MSDVLEVVGCVAAAGLVGTALLSRSRNLRAGTVVAGLVIAAALVAGEAWDDVESLRDRPALFGAAIVFGAAALAALAALIRRVPPALPLLLVAALPVPRPDRGGDRGRQPALAALPRHRRWGDRRRGDRAGGRGRPRTGGAPSAPVGARGRGRALRGAVRLLRGRRLRDAERVVLPRPVRGDVRPAHRHRLDAAAARPRFRGDRRRGGPVLRRRYRPGDRRRDLLEPGPGALERLPLLLPRELALLGPEHLRPLSGAGGGDRGRRRAVGARRRAQSRSPPACSR